MKKTEFKNRVSGIMSQTMNACAGYNFEPCRDWFGEPCINVFQYAATSEFNMQKRLEENGKSRISTFMSDLSIGEYVSGVNGVIDTARNAMNGWKDDEKMMAEFVLCVNWKAWEHAARENTNWAKFYSILFELCRDLMYDYYEGDSEKTSYFWQYLD